ncbi:class I SAM-dependent methyltransferase [Bradymonas sediminis]|uniref:Uncharacterized protein n=1 Tax=Bradymonas sediminis TaxID=1548548 RepID=A0A2Z4FND2_9DELT|nr:methyltransferase domain-containing protein [Bradymonas sediminis]AWV90507.1 hypothetical protein DN745_14700 [Bradymonas sediminis]TDP72100.1 mannose-1-phosphate guanylyltransferase [Bradymonas sediminis]
MATHPQGRAQPRAIAAKLIELAHARVDERGRWSSAARVLEFQRTMRLLGEQIQPRSRLLELGATSTLYTTALARRGHRMTVVSTRQAYLQKARRELNEHALADQVRLIFLPTLGALPMQTLAHFDAVLIFEPLLHLLDDDERRRMAGEAVRLLRNDGHIIVHFFPPASGYIRALKLAETHPDQIDEATIDRVFESHILSSEDTAGALQFEAEVYLSLDEVTELFASLGVEFQDAQSLNGIAARREAEFLELGDESPRLFEVCRDLLEQSSRDPEIIATGDRAAWVGRKVRRH